jgi:macrolide-specific efflux system membrane fusion protein
LAVIQNDLELCKLELSELKKELEKYTIVSPIDGQVAYINELDEGAFIEAYSTVIRVIDPNDIVLEYKGSASKSFKMGMEVTVGINEDVYKGKVIFTPSSVPPKDMHKYVDTIRVKVMDIPDEVKEGDFAMLQHVLEYSENAVIIPANAFNKIGEQEIAYVLENGLRIERYIETGIKTKGKVEIISGIEPGEEIIIR